ncbi:mobilisation protein B [Bacteroides eggerthii]|uniref:Mobilisation protein B n=2 Tax=Bacteroides eggerthii TaxID=28111 RepID=A0A380ZC07_9BACE|nr:mobilisation protein B [Bacteroides eggerthii]
MLSINPSGEEQRHLIEKVTGKKVGEFSELTAGGTGRGTGRAEKNFSADAWTNMPGTFTGRKSSPVMIWYGMDVWNGTPL